ncbi:hypothetical protein Mro03_08600 [Microbispora rosea subsp. rosea]|nr:hypothetical protein Mro03_08600 [Microbispora rosea subsp. rosea]
MTGSSSIWDYAWNGAAGPTQAPALHRIAFCLSLSQWSRPKGEATPPGRPDQLSLARRDHPRRKWRLPNDPPRLYL